MKKAIVLVLALAGMAQAATNIAVDETKPLTCGLVALWTFDDNSTDYLTTTGVTAALAPGITNNSSLQNAGGIDGNGYLHSDGTIEMYNGFGSFNVSANDFTISMKVKGLTADYKTLVSFNLGNTQVNLQTSNANNGSQICAYGIGAFTANNTSGLLRGSEWANIVITGTNGAFTMYVNDLTTTGSYTVSDGTNISNFQLSSLWGDGQRKATADFDDVAIWNRALSSTEIAALTGGSTVQGYTVTKPAPGSIPEPATATLSLLALAGLAVRRRRK